MRTRTASSAHPKPGTLIGYPYQGTHAVDFNKAGGSNNWESENAVDVWLFAGTPILAIANGVVSPGSWGYGKSAKGGRFAGWRAHLIIGTSAWNAKGFVCFYTHLHSLIVAKGAHVEQGQVIGYSGIANGVPHLHFAVMPGFHPQDYVQHAYSLTMPRYGKGSGGGGGGGGHPPPPSIEDSWHVLMGVFGDAYPDAAAQISAASKQLPGAVS